MIAAIWLERGGYLAVITHDRVQAKVLRSGPVLPPGSIWGAVPVVDGKSRGVLVRLVTRDRLMAN